MPRDTPVQVTIETIPLKHPPVPDPLNLQKVTYKKCGKNYCLTPKEAKKDLANKAETGRWITQAKNVICYYRKNDPPNSPSFCKKRK
jgi:hypothetical protein